jgi:hypothetical protein
MIDVSLSVGHGGFSALARALRAGRGVGPLGAGLLALAACGEQNAYVPPPPPKVAVAQPLQQEVPLYVELTGNTKAFNEVKLEARVQGFLEQINMSTGPRSKRAICCSSSSRTPTRRSLIRPKPRSKPTRLRRPTPRSNTAVRRR